MSATWNSGRLPISSTTRSPWPTPSARECRGEPGGPVGVLAEGQLAEFVAGLLADRHLAGPLVDGGEEPGRDRVFHGRHVIHKWRWRTGRAWVENLARDGEYWRAARPEEIVGAPPPCGLLYADSPRDELSCGLNNRAPRRR